MNLVRDSIYIELFDNKTIISFELSDSSAEKIIAEVKLRLKQREFKNKSVPKLWRAEEGEIAPVHTEGVKPTEYLPYLLLLLKQIVSSGGTVNSTQIRYYASDSNQNLIGGSFAIDSNSMYVTRIETYPNGTVTIEKYHFDEPYNELAWSDGEFLAKVGTVVAVGE